MHWPRIRGLCSVSWCLAEGQWNGDQRRPMGSKAQEGLYSLFYMAKNATLEKLYCGYSMFAQRGRPTNYNGGQCTGCADFWN